MNSKRTRMGVGIARDQLSIYALDLFETHNGLHIDEDSQTLAFPD
jgi:hypothetical protein